MNPRDRRVAAAVGVASLAGGILALVGVVGGTVPGLTTGLYVAGGVLGVGMTYLLYRDWFPDSAVRVPEVERASEFPVPGDEFDRTLSQFRARGRGHLPDRKAIHDRLCDLAAGTLERQGYDRSAATAAVENGDFPADPPVANFLADPDAELPRSWTDRARRLIGSEDGPSDFQELVRRTVDALAARSELVDSGDASDSRVVPDPPRRDSHTTHHTGASPDADPEPVATGRWRAVVPVALAFVGIGFVFRQAPVVLAGGVALGFAVYARGVVPPAASVAIERTIDVEDPDPGDPVEVTVRVRNQGGRTLPDLRIVDGVPAALSVTDGSPRHGTALRPGASTSFTYTVTARRGRHDFDPASVAVRDYAGATRRVSLVPAAEGATTSLACVPDLEGLSVPVPLYEQSSQYLGRLPAEGGEGVEFHATREYRPGDPISRIDWKRLARSTSGDFTTVQFREERAATVVLVVDALPAAYLAADPEGTPAIERSISAAGGLFDSLLGTGDRVGVAALGPTPSWVTPGADVSHRRTVRELLAADAAFPPTAPANDDFPVHWVREFHRRYPAETQVVLLSPLCDRRYGFVIRRLQAYGHPVTVVSPDPTTDGTVGQRLVRLERRFRIEQLREAGVHVVDLPADEELAVALERAAERWSR